MFENTSSLLLARSKALPTNRGMEKQICDRRWLPLIFQAGAIHMRFFMGQDSLMIVAHC